jgi:hypothetical protein
MTIMDEKNRKVAEHEIKWKWDAWGREDKVL